MILKLNVTEDAELRAFIKQAILDVCKSIPREEINQAIAEETERKFNAITKGGLESIIRAELRNMFDRHLRTYKGIFDPEIFDFEKWIEQIVSKKIEDVDWKYELKKAIESQARAALSSLKK